MVCRPLFDLMSSLSQMLGLGLSTLELSLCESSSTMHWLLLSSPWNATHFSFPIVPSPTPPKPIVDCELCFKSWGALPINLILLLVMKNNPQSTVREYPDPQNSCRPPDLSAATFNFLLFVTWVAWAPISDGEKFSWTPGIELNYFIIISHKYTS